MRCFKSILPASLALVTVACAPQASLNPLCTNEQAVAETSLVGVWQADSGEEYLEIRDDWPSAASAGPENDGDFSYEVAPDFRTYSIQYVKGKDRQVSTFSGKLVRLGDDLFMDLAPGEVPVDADFKYFQVSRTRDGEFPRFTKLAELFFMALVPSSPKEGAPREETTEIRMISAHTFIKVTLDGDQLSAAYLDGKWLQDMIRDGRVSIEHQQVGETIFLTAPSDELQDLVQRFSNDPQAFKELGEWRRKR